MSLAMHSCILGALMCLCGCTVYRIKPWNDQRPEGVPFYTTKPVCEKKTTYIQPIYTVVVTKPPGQGSNKPPITVLTRNLSLHVRVSPPCAAEIASLLSGNVRIVNGNGDAAVLSSCPEAEPPDAKSFPDGKDLILAGNTASFVSVIDADHRYSFNVKRPLAGSSTGDITLAPDGTLQKATATVNDQSVQTLVSALTSITGAATQITRGGPTAPEVDFYGATISTTTYVWTAAQYLPSAKTVEVRPKSDETCTPGDLIQLNQSARTTRQLEASPDAGKPQDSSQQKKP